MVLVAGGCSSLRAVTILMICTLSGGCGSPRPPSDSAIESGGRPQPAAFLVDNAAVSWDAVRPALAEAAGGSVIRESALDVLLQRELVRRGQSISLDAAQREEAIILESLSPDANQAARLLDQLRARDGLGPVRWRSLLVRNASLRALVSQDVEITPALRDIAFDVAHGPRRDAHIVVVRSLRESESVNRRLESGESMSDLAAEFSIDPSAGQGGLLPPIARKDPSYPVAIREAIWSTPIRSHSSPIVVENGFAIIEPIRERPADNISPDSVAAETDRAVRRTQERALMDQLAARLLRDSNITVLDDSLNDAWRRTATGSATR